MLAFFSAVVEVVIGQQAGDVNINYRIRVTEQERGRSRTDRKMVRREYYREHRQRRRGISCLQQVYTNPLKGKKATASLYG